MISVTKTDTTPVGFYSKFTNAVWITNYQGDNIRFDTSQNLARQAEWFGSLDKCLAMGEYFPLLKSDTIDFSGEQVSVGSLFDTPAAHSNKFPDGSTARGGNGGSIDLPSQKSAIACRDGAVRNRIIQLLNKYGLED